MMGARQLYVPDSPPFHPRACPDVRCAAGFWLRWQQGSLGQRRSARADPIGLDRQLPEVVVADQARLGLAVCRHFRFS